MTIGSICEHPLTSPVRPIVITLCDAVVVTQRSVVCGIMLFLVCVALLVAGYCSAEAFRGAIKQILRARVEDPLTETLAGPTARYTLQLVLTNASFLTFRSLILGVLIAAYELRKDKVFSLLILIVFVLMGALAAKVFLPDTSILSRRMLPDYYTLCASATASTTLLSWFWARYVTHKGKHAVFDYDVSAAIVRLRKY